MQDLVLIAGAGPVGMTAAVYLALNDVPVIVFEAGADLAVDLRGSTFHPPTLDLLDQFDGVTKRLIGQGLIAPTWQYRDRRTGPVATWDMSLLRDDTGHPYRVQSEQWKLTRILRDLLDPLPHAEIRFGHKVAAVSQDGDFAALKVETPDGTETLRGRYAIGADGANSVVRQCLDIDFDGMTFPELFVTLSTPFEFADHLPALTHVNYLSDPDEWLIMLRVVENWRMLFPTRPGESREDILSEAGAQRRLNAVLSRDEPYEVVHRTLYHVHERVAARYRVGRVLLAGDGAHINNPIGGMGMNGGIQDAFNLGEKLVRIWRGEAEDDLLDRYERQRRHMAIQGVQANTIRNRENMREKDPELRAARQEEMRRTAEDPVAAREFLLRSSMISSLREAATIE